MSQYTHAYTRIHTDRHTYMAYEGERHLWRHQGEEFFQVQECIVAANIGQTYPTISNNTRRMLSEVNSK